MQRRGVVVAFVAFVAMVALAACGSGARLAGRVRTAAEISSCLRAAHLKVDELRPAGTRTVKAVGLQALVAIDDGDAAPESIGVYRDRADAAKSFRNAGDAAELLDGNAILAITADPLAPSSASMKRLERCAFGPGSRPSQSSVYRAEYTRPDSGRAVVMRSGCLGCHMIGSAGNNGPGENLTDIGRQLTAAKITDVLRNPVAPMPSFSGLERSDPRAWRGLISYLSHLGR